MQSQSTKGRKAKENLVFHNGSTCDIKFDGCCYVEDYYKPIKTNNTFNDNYIEYKSNGDTDKNLSLEEFLDMIKPYLSNIINNHKKWKIQLTMPINFISSKDLKGTRTMHTKSDNIKIMTGSETNDIIKELFKSLQKYQERLEEAMRKSEFIFDSVDLLYYHLNNISLKRGKSYDQKNKKLDLKVRKLGKIKSIKAAELI